MLVYVSKWSCHVVQWSCEWWVFSLVCVSVDLVHAKLNWRVNLEWREVQTSTSSAVSDSLHCLLLMVCSAAVVFLALVKCLSNCSIACSDALKAQTLRIGCIFAAVLFPITFRLNVLACWDVLSCRTHRTASTGRVVYTHSWDALMWNSFQFSQLPSNYISISSSLVSKKEATHSHSMGSKPFPARTPLTPCCYTSGPRRRFTCSFWGRLERVGWRIWSICLCCRRDLVKRPP